MFTSTYGIGIAYINGGIGFKTFTQITTSCFFELFLRKNLFVENILAFGVVALFGAGKELYDYKSYGKFDVLDLLATISAALVLTILY